MFRALRRPATSRVVGLVAAYALALQVLLGGMVATRMAAASDAVFTMLCSGADMADSSAHPSAADPSAPGPEHAGKPPCAVCAFAGLTPLVPPATALPLAQAMNRRRRETHDTAARPRRRRREPRSSRGPPPAG